MKKIALTLMIAAAVAAAPVQQAQAGLIKKLFVVGSVVVGGVALSKAQATKHCTEAPTDPQCAKSVKGTDADPALAAPTAGAALAKPRDANSMIDAGAAKAKTATASVGAWIAKKKAEHEARKAAAAAGAQPGAIAPAPAPAVAQ